MVKAKKFVFTKVIDGFPKPSDFKLVEEELPDLKDGEYLAEAVYLSVDPYVKGFTFAHIPGNTVFGDQIAKVVESKHKDFPVGSYIVGGFGWRSHTIRNGDDKEVPFASFLPTYIIPDREDLSKSLTLGVLGMPGNSAYFPVVDIIKPKPGETIVVSGAAGGVGSLAGQIAKIKGARVIGITGNDEKAKWLTKDLGFDVVINYKKGNLKEELEKAAPNGIDGYFDNVGGEISSTVLYQMNVDGRVAVVGTISTYTVSSKVVPLAPVIQLAFIMKQLQMKGFYVMRYVDRWYEGVNQIKDWIKEGKVKYQETVTNGFENAPAALAALFKGENKGKTLIKVQ